jgi:hypothetical protein
MEALTLLTDSEILLVPEAAEVMFLAEDWTNVVAEVARWLIFSAASARFAAVTDSSSDEEERIPVLSVTAPTIPWIQMGLWHRWGGTNLQRGL